MARPRQFNESEALDRALAAFWKQGYEACAISDLIAATGLQRQSLYNTFGDKEALFLAALQRYRERTEQSLAPLRQADADLKTIHRYMVSVLATQRAGSFAACLLVKTAFSPHLGEAKIRHAVQSGAAAVRTIFAKVIRAEMKRGKLAANTNASAYAAYLYAMLNGLSALAATGGSDQQITAALGQAFARL